MYIATKVLSMHIELKFDLYVFLNDQFLFNFLITLTVILRQFNIWFLNGKTLVC